MRNPPPSATTPNTWIGHKDQGKAYFQREEYPEALRSYRAALNPEYGCPSSERQIILSNVVACRLKIGGPAQASAAIEEAKQCIALNSSWAKGHIRLASAYIELGGHSNDACNELQRALALDPGNPTARQMLVRELRRDHSPVPTAPSEELDERRMSPPPRNPHHVPNEVSDSATRSGSSTYSVPDEQASEQATQPDDVGDPLQENLIDESLSWSDRMKFHVSRLVAWYQGLSEDTKTVMKVVIGIAILYVAFGGRFGLDSLFGNRHENRGNYERGNAYDQFYHQTSNNGYSSSDGRKTSSGFDSQYRPTSSPRHNSRSFHFPSLFDGSIQSMLCLAGIAYVCHRNNINPFHALFMLNMLTGNRGRGRGMRHVGLAGLGYGAARGVYQNRRRRRNGWY